MHYAKKVVPLRPNKRIYIKREKQLRNYLDQLRAIDFIKTEGERGQMVYMLGKGFLENSDIITKALKIGLKTLMETGEI